jgi:hypothetical protein
MIYNKSNLNLYLNSRKLPYICNKNPIVVKKGKPTIIITRPEKNTMAPLILVRLMKNWIVAHVPIVIMNPAMNDIYIKLDLYTHNMLF